MKEQAVEEMVKELIESPLGKMATGFEANLLQRPRRNRASAAIRALSQETFVLPHMLVAPLFVVEGSNEKQPIASMPGVHRFSIDLLIKEVAHLYSLGVRAIDLFPLVPNEKKDRWGSEAIRPNNLMQRAVRAVKNTAPEMCVMVDVALDPFTNHGHDGVVVNGKDIVNDATLKMLAQMSVRAAEAGADMIAPSDMMDGRVGCIRKALDEHGHQNTGILSYAVKYASAMYGPFRNALNSAPKFGDKKTYQMNPANRREALREVILDEQEGVDMLMIKPALAYLDVISHVRQITNLPIAAYQVSGEYAMIMAAAEKGWVDSDRVLMECLISMRRAGADFIFTYAAGRMAEQLQKRGL